MEANILRNHTEMVGDQSGERPGIRSVLGAHQIRLRLSSG